MGGALGSVRREWGQPSFFVMKIQILEILEIVILKIEFLTQSTLKIWKVENLKVETYI